MFSTDPVPLNMSGFIHFFYGFEPVVDPLQLGGGEGD